MAQQAIQTKVLRITGYVTTTLVIILSLISLFADCVTITSVFGHEMAIFQGICSPSPKPESEEPKQSTIEKVPTKNLPITKTIPQTEYSILENQPQFVAFAKTHLSIQFQNIGGEEFVSLHISPQGHQSIIKAVVGSDTFEFESPTGTYSLSVLNIDYQSRTVSVQISKKQITP
ncbi:hypothetical protein BGP_5563 [Beggiatoa sp. PS]|nr:hypothetical protein BGP_5563 [Beggiatoa sp. PS]